jgi:DEAD/DEAH box helicase domain-containing protein
MRYIAFDLETQNTFEDVGAYDPSKLDISVASVYDSGTDTFTTVGHTELEKLWPIFEKAEALVGYNSNHFDIPLLNKYYPGDITKIKSIDLLESIKNSLGRRLRMDSVAEATLGTRKSGHGLQAIMWWREGAIDKIMKYCEKDVDITKRLFEYALEHKELKFKDGRTARSIPIDTTGWDTIEHHAMTHSLPF